MITKEQQEKCQTRAALLLAETIFLAREFLIL
jgi:hypothetical protein